MSEHLDQEELARFIELTSLFNGLEEGARAKIAAAMVQRTYEAGTNIIRQGQTADTLFIITLGRVGVFRQDEKLGVEQEVAQLGLLQEFGEMAILLDEPRGASVRALEDVTCAVLSREAFENIVKAIPTIGLSVARNLAQRLSERNRQLGFRFIRLMEEPFDPELYGMIPPQLLERHQMVPLRMEDDALLVAMTRPYDSAGYEAMAAAVQGVTIRTLACALDDYNAFLRNVIRPSRGFRQDGSPGDAVRKLDYSPRDLQVVGIDTGGGHSAMEVSGAQVIKKLNEIITEAVNLGVSDIHFEPGTKDMRIRQRLDGRMTPAGGGLPLEYHAPMVSRIKVMGGMDISERRRAQDGRLSLRMRDRPYDIRISTMPTQHGEKVVMRILDPESALIPLNQLILSSPLADVVHKAVFRPMGGIVVAGPTGSGKTTTLYSAVNERKGDSEDLNIVTIEDPIEYTLEGVNQTQVSNQEGHGFSDMLRALLRQDPDVILLGETRDPETARIALESALTGHLVLTTVHADGAVEAATRFVEMGCTPYLVGTALDLVVAQRLLRRICPNCRAETTPSELVRRNLERAGILDMAQSEVLSKGGGCSGCHKTGFQGRVGAYEVLRLNDPIREAIGLGESEATLRRLGQETNALTSFQDYSAFLLTSGLTSPAEVLRYFGQD